MAGGPREAINIASVWTSLQQIARFIDDELRKNCEGPKNCVAVMEHVLGNSLVFPHFLDYYLKPSDARIQAKLVCNLKSELQQVKGVHSVEKLAYKGALLNAIVAFGIDNRQASLYSWILQSNP